MSFAEALYALADYTQYYAEGFSYGDFYKILVSAECLYCFEKTDDDKPWDMLTMEVQNFYVRRVLYSDYGLDIKGDPRYKQ